MSPPPKSLSSLSKNLQSASKNVSSSEKLSNIISHTTSKIRKPRNVLNTVTISSSKSIQQKLSFPIQKTKTISNPYTIRTSTPSPAISVQTKIQKSLPTDDSWIGSTISHLEQKHARIWIQNVNGLNITNL